MKEQQDFVHGWVVEHGGYWDQRDMGLRLSEKSGNLCRGLRAEPRLVFEAIGDLLFNVMAIANTFGYDCEVALEEAIKRYNERFPDGSVISARME